MILSLYIGLYFSFCKIYGDLLSSGDTSMNCLKLGSKHNYLWINLQFIKRDLSIEYIWLYPGPIRQQTLLSLYIYIYIKPYNIFLFIIQKLQKCWLKHSLSQNPKLLVSRLNIYFCIRSHWTPTTAELYWMNHMFVLYNHCNTQILFFWK